MKAPAKKPSRARRADAPVTGRRLNRGDRATAPVAMHEALSGHALVPNVKNVPPSVSSKQQRFLQVLARHLARDDPWIRNLCRVLGDVHIGVGPKPKSRFPELDELWELSKDQFDNRGDFGFGDWLREIYRCRTIDGDVFIRRRNRMDSPLGRELYVPIQFQALTSEFVPLTYSKTLGSLDFVCGVSRRFDRVTHYAVHTEHPEERMAGNEPIILPANEVYHVCERRLGAPRGEVPLASALMRAIKASTLEDAELRRKMVASLLNVFVKRPISDGDDFDLPSESEVSDMIEAMTLSTGGILELPYGHEVQTLEPKDEPQNFERALRWQLMAVCAAAGIPPHEVTGDWTSIPERMTRYVGQSMERRAEIEQGTLERQLLNPMRRDWIDTVMAAGMWFPPEDAQPWQLYGCTWEWPILPMASFKQELEVMLKALEEGIVTRSYIQKSMFGTRPEEVDREAVREAARATVLGLSWADEVWTNDTPLAARYEANALEIEQTEIDLVDDSGLEDSILD